MSLEFLIDIKSFRSHYGPGVGSASNRNEYQEHFLGGKGGRCVRLTTLPPSCAVVTKSGNLNFLEPSGPPGACNGTDLTFLRNTAAKAVFLYFHWSVYPNARIILKDVVVPPSSSLAIKRCIWHRWPSVLRRSKKRTALFRWISCI